MGKGGRRPGAGRPKGRKDNKTLTKEAGREIVRQMVMAQIGPLVEAQIANSRGLKYLVIRDKKSGKFVRVTEAMAGSLQGDEQIEVWEKEPSVSAFTDLLNRALDKPAEQEQAVAVSGELVIRHEMGG